MMGGENLQGKFKCENIRRKFKGYENHHFPKNTPTGYSDLKKTHQSHLTQHRLPFDL